MTMSDSLVETVKCNLAHLYKQKNFFIDTKDVKKALCRACKTIPDVSAFATGVDARGEKVKGLVDGKEWLFDVTGLRYDEKGYISRTVLVAESEWLPEWAIRYDFEKLLLARADVRVMVFDGTKKPGYKEIFKRFETRIKKYDQSEKGDIWFFAALLPKGWKFRRIDACILLSCQDIE